MENSQHAPSNSDVIEMPLVFSKNACIIYNGTSSWESMYQFLEREGPNIIQRIAIVDVASSSEAHNYESTNPFLHRIATRHKILPYTDIVKWIIDNINIVDMEFLTLRKIVIGSFTTEYLKKMYHILDP